MARFLSAIFAALVATLLLIPTADAGCHAVTYQYAAPAYVAPVYPQYAVVTPYAVPFVVNANQFYQVAPELAQMRVNQEMVQAAADKAAAKAVDNFAAALLRQQAVLAPAAPGQGTPASPLATPAQAGSYAEKVQVMVNSKCLSCHNAPGKNKIDLTDVRKLGRDQAREMVLRTMADPADVDYVMPKPMGGQKGVNIAPEELNSVHAFAREFPAQPTPRPAPSASIPDAPAIPKLPPVPADKK